MNKYYYSYNLYNINPYIIDNTIKPLLGNGYFHNELIIVLPNNISIDFLKNYFVESLSAISTKFITSLPALKSELYSNLKLNKDFAKKSILLNPSGKIALMKKVLEDQSFTYFKNAYSFRGFTKYLLELIDNLKKINYSQHNGEYFFDLNKVLTQFKKVTNEYKGLNNKYNELFNIISSYERLKSDYSFVDSNDVDYFILSHLNLKDSLLKATNKIFLLSFNSTGLDLELIDILSNNGIEIILSFLFDTNRPSQFFNGGIIKDRLDKLGFKNDSITNKVNKDSYTFDGLLSTLFMDNSVTKLDSQPFIRIIKGNNIYDEVLRIAKKIKLLLYHNPSLKLGDIAIVIRNPNKYEYYINEVFDKLNLPHYGSFNRSLISEKLITTIFNIMELKIKNFPNDLLMSFIKSNYVYLNKDLIDLKSVNTNTIVSIIDKYYNEITGDVSILSYLLSIREGLDKDFENIDMCISYIKKVIELINEFPLANEQIPIHDIYTLIKRMITNNFSILYNSYKYSDMDTARRDSVILNKFLEVLDEFIYFQSQILDKMTFYSFYSVFRDIVFNCYYNIKITRDYRINILTEVDVNGLWYSFPIVFVLGLVEDDFPKQVTTDILIRDYEKALINHSYMVLPTIDMQTRYEELLFLMSIGCSSRKLYLSYPIVGEDRRDSLPSFFLDDVIDILAKDMNELEVSIDNNIYSKEELYNYLGNSFSYKDSSINRLMDMVDIDSKLVTLIKDKCIIEAKRASVGFSSYEGFIAETGNINLLSKKLRDRINIITPSHLEMYANCPYRFFLYYVLGLKDKKQEKDKWSSSDKGSLAHRILFDLYGIRISSGAWSDIEDSLYSKVKEIANKIINEYNPDPLYLVGELDKLINNITIFVEKDLKENIDFTPHSLELDFSNNGLPLSILTKRDSHPTYLEGIIDRVDISNDGNSFRVIDYKAGNSSLSKTKLVDLIKEGQRFQPLIYSAIVEHIYGSLKDYSYYFVLSSGSKGIKKTGVTLNEKIDGTNITLKDISIYYVELYLNWIYSGRFHISPRECPSYCEFINVCRVNKVKTDLNQKDSPFWPGVDDIINELESS